MFDCQIVEKVVAGNWQGIDAVHCLPIWELVIACLAKARNTVGEEKHLIELLGQFYFAEFGASIVVHFLEERLQRVPIACINSERPYLPKIVAQEEDIYRHLSVIEVVAQ